ncbi:hypothetical protein Sp245p_23675 (plasmid) [Azospirillum baldaniorum]|uniref:Gluconate 5-dehydrogenase n=1 Tax=Azospirillum baldaniorum TaxID=1064539 RepID=A0A9P1NRG8_9PROT|nr:hypothetical protein Sp245p_23675 [Azospirillum baldaniorum]CCD02608.1 protein of unknown function [Azospirillum baldaniorum]
MTPVRTSFAWRDSAHGHKLPAGLAGGISIAVFPASDFVNGQFIFADGGFMAIYGPRPSAEPPPLRPRSGCRTER